jgi:hypothetical protein
MMSNYTDFQVISEIEWRKETTRLIMKAAEELVELYGKAYDKKPVMRGFRKKVRRILNRGDIG